MLDRAFQAPAPNRKWIADFTYIWTAEGWLYVAAVLDLFSRQVVGWSMSATMTAQFVADASMMAIWRRGKPEALLHHSDRGSQYLSEQFQRLMADHGIVCSMSRAGNVWDNAAMESFFSSLKTERMARKTYRTRNQAKAFDYIERGSPGGKAHYRIGAVCETCLALGSCGVYIAYPLNESNLEVAMARKRKKQITRKQGKQRKQKKQNLAGMDFDSLMNLRNQVDEALTRYRSTLERQLGELGSSVASFGGKIARGMRGSRMKGRKVAPKYRGPGGETWAGRGAKPRWLTAAIKEGKKLENFLIDKSGVKARKKT